MLPLVLKRRKCTNVADGRHGPHVVVVSENREERRLLQQLLHFSFHTCAVNILDDAVPCCPAQPADLILLAYHAPPPVTAIRSLARATPTPVLLLVDPLRVDEHGALLEAGVCFVLFRPYSPLLLTQQLSALLRHTMAARTSSVSLTRLSYGSIQLDLDAHTVQVIGQPARCLTLREFRLLRVLIQNPGHVFSTSELIAQVWGTFSEQGEVGALRDVVHRLRKKIEAEPHHPRYLVAVRGVGYTLAPGDVAASRPLHE